MANFDKSGMTQAGINLMGKAIGGATIQFTKLVLGDGTMTGEILDLQGVVSPKENVDVTRIERNDNQCTVGGELLTSSVKQGFFWRECGLYAMDPDIGEILYNYACSTKPDYIASSNSGIMEEILVSMIATVGNNTNVNVTIDDSMVFATKKVVDKIESNILNIDLMPQCPLPAKQGVSTQSFKLFRKIDSDHYKIVQKADNGYIEYELYKTRGDSSVSYGVNWELLRLLSVQQVLECFMWKEPTNTSNLTVSIQASEWNSVDANLVYNNTVFKESNRQGFALYDLAPNSEYEITLSSRKNGKGNILYLGNTGRSNAVEIYINDVLVKTFNANNGGLTGNYQTIEYPIVSVPNSSETYKLKIKNADPSNKFSFVCFNFSSLSNYDGKEVDSYKIYKRNSYFINETGASDYALRNKENNKWFGSYHGGEVCEFLKGTWNSSKLGEDFFATEKDLNTVSDNSFTLVKNLKITQKTKLIEMADMLSIYDFNVDGTMNMTFGLSNCNVPLSDFYTALTCTHTDFTKVVYPSYGDIALNNDTFYKIQNGYIEQMSSDGGRKIGIRFNVFNNFYNTKGCFIRNNNSYSKFYYGIVSEYLPGVVVSNLTFNKALDFYNVQSW